MSESRDEQQPDQAKQAWVHPTITFVGPITMLVGAGAASGKKQMPEEGDPDNMHIPRPHA